MKKQKVKGAGVDRVRLWLYGTAATLVTTLAFGGWAARDYIENNLASKSEFVVVQVQATTALDNQMEDLIARITNLERKLNKTQDDRDQIKFLRDQLERLRRIRAGK